MNKSSMGTPSTAGQDASKSAGADANKTGGADANKTGAQDASGNKIVEQAKQAVTHVVSDAAGRAKEQVNTELDSRKDKAVETMDSVAHALRETGSKLKGVGPLAELSGQAADGVEKVADFFDGKQIGDVVRDVERFARREPALFLGAAFALGLIGGRFLKSSSHRGATANGNSGGYGVQVSQRSAASAASYGAQRPAAPKRFSAESSTTTSTATTKNGLGSGSSGSV